MKSKKERYRVLTQQINSTFQVLKEERRGNLTKLPVDETVRTGQILSIKKMISLLESSNTWESMNSTISCLKEMRFLGSPKRTEVSNQIIKQLASLYATDPDDTRLVTCLTELLKHEQTNPLHLNDGNDAILIDADGNGGDNIKMVIDTGLDIETHLLK